MKEIIQSIKTTTSTKIYSPCTRNATRRTQSFQPSPRTSVCRFIRQLQRPTTHLTMKVSTYYKLSQSTTDALNMGAVIFSSNTIQDLGTSAIKESSIATQIVVGKTTTCISLESYIVKIPMANGQDAMLSDGTCLQQLTATFPEYPLNKVNQTIK